MKAIQIMQRPVIAATPETSVRDIAYKLLNHGISGMPVVERDGTVRGVVTEADILRVQRSGKELEGVTVKEIMTAMPIAIDVEASIEEARKLLQEFHILRVPVTQHGKLVGIVSRRDIIRAMLEPEFLTF